MVEINDSLGFVVSDDASLQHITNRHRRPALINQDEHITGSEIINKETKKINNFEMNNTESLNLGLFADNTKMKLNSNNPKDKHFLQLSMSQSHQNNIENDDDKSSENHRSIEDLNVEELINSLDKNKLDDDFLKEDSDEKKNNNEEKEDTEKENNDQFGGMRPINQNMNFLGGNSMNIINEVLAQQRDQFNHENNNISNQQIPLQSQPFSTQQIPLQQKNLPNIIKEYQNEQQIKDTKQMENKYGTYLQPIEEYKQLPVAVQKIKKLELFGKLVAIKQSGVELSRQYTYDDSYDDLYIEYMVQYNKKSKEDGVGLAKSFMVNAITGIEFLNHRYDPFGFKLDGWSDHLRTSMETKDNLSYNEVIGEIYEKYRKSGKKMEPEIKLMLMVGFSAASFHASKVIANTNSLGEAIKNNPELLEMVQSGIESKANKFFAGPTQDELQKKQNKEQQQLFLNAQKMQQQQMQQQMQQQQQQMQQQQMQQPVMARSSLSSRFEMLKRQENERKQEMDQLSSQLNRNRNDNNNMNMNIKTDSEQSHKSTDSKKGDKLKIADVDNQTQSEIMSNNSHTIDVTTAVRGRKKITRQPLKIDLTE